MKYKQLKVICKNCRFYWRFYFTHDTRKHKEPFVRLWLLKTQKDPILLKSFYSYHMERNYND